MPTRSRLAPSTRAVTVVISSLALVLTSCAAESVRDVPEQAVTETETIGNIATQMPNEPAKIEGDLAVSEQHSDGTSVTIDEAHVGDRDPDFEDTTRSWVVIYSDESGSPAAPIGHAQVTALGTGEGLEVELDEPIEKTQTLWAVLHWDSNTTGTFEPGVDFAIVDNATGDTLQRSFRVVVQDE